MPRKQLPDTPKPEEFGTGLRTHLERTRTGEPPEPEQVEPEAGAPAGAELDTEEHALEERRRELAERREQIGAVEATLRVREQRIAEVRARLSDEERRLSAAEAELTATGDDSVDAPRNARVLLRERLEREAEAVWGAFSTGLTAIQADGRPDVAARIAAAQALLAEAYGPPGGADSSEKSDELAPLRERRREAGS